MSEVKHQGWLVLLAILIMISGLRFVVYLSWNHAVKEYVEVEDNYRELAERAKSLRQDRFDIYYELLALRYVVREMDVDISLVRKMTDGEFERMFLKEKQ